MAANSRFISSLAPVESVAEARAFLAQVRAEFSDAAHHVPAYLIGGGGSAVAHCSDDGEPAGTAGRPVLVVLQNSGLGDVALVVTRYFGGTLLGTGGLVRAYTEAAQAAVAAVPRARKVPGLVLMLATPYTLLERLRLLTAHHHGLILDEAFAADVTLTLRFPTEAVPAFQAALRELSAGRLQAEVIEPVTFRLPV